MIEINIMFLFSECIFCLLAALTLVLSKTIDAYKRRNLSKMFLCGSALFIFDVHSWFFEGKVGKIAWYGEKISTFFAFFLPYLLMVLYHIYVYHNLFGNYRFNKKIRIPLKRYYTVFFCVLFATIVNVFPLFNDWIYYIDESNTYSRGPLYGLAYVFGFVALVTDASVLIQYRDNTSRTMIRSLFTYVLAPGVALLAQQFVDGISTVNLSIGISLMVMYITAILEQNKIEKRKSEQIYEAQIDLMLSQVGPHFIYNTLTTIKHLCKKDPKIAMETIDEFAAYLRGNLDSLTVRQRIPFSAELKHVKNYISLEKKRFGDRICVEYDLAETDFLVPALLLQPIVENAIKHGITKKEEGGHILIKTYKNPQGYVILVEDDGVGFDVKAFEQSGRLKTESVVFGKQEITKRHLGIENVRNRLESMCGGTLVVDSIIGKKTQIMMSIPFDEE